MGQAGRISGVSPADISVLLIWLAAHGTEQNKEGISMTDHKVELIAGAKALGIKVSPSQAEQFQIYLELLLPGTKNQPHRHYRPRRGGGKAFSGFHFIEPGGRFK